MTIVVEVPKNKMSEASLIAGIYPFIVFILILVLYQQAYIFSDMWAWPLIPAIFAMIFLVFLFISPTVAGFTAVITGIICLVRLKKTGGRGKAYAIAGIILGILSILLSSYLLLIYLN